MSQSNKAIKNIKDTVLITIKPVDLILIINTELCSESDIKNK